MKRRDHNTFARPKRHQAPTVTRTAGPAVERREQAAALDALTARGARFRPERPLSPGRPPSRARTAGEAALARDIAAGAYNPKGPRWGG